MAQINVSGLPAVMTDVNATLKGFSHPNSPAAQVILESPTRKRVLLMGGDISEGGRCHPASGAFDLTFDDAAATKLNTPWRSGSFKPTGYPASCSQRNVHTVSPTGHEMSTFNGENPNGTWSIYAANELWSGGSFSGGWSLNITASPLLTSGDLQVQGPEKSAFHDGRTCGFAGDGGAITYPVRIYNTSSTAARYYLKVPGSFKLYPGAFSNTVLPQGPFGYLTAEIPAGSSKTLYVKIKFPVSQHRSGGMELVRLSDANGGQLDQVTVCAQEAAGRDAGAAHMLLKAGNQKPASGEFDPLLTGKTLVPGGAGANFTVTLKNKSATAERQPFSLENWWFTCDNIKVTVKDGRTDVTTAVVGGTYGTPPLLPGTSRNLAITVIATSPHDGSDRTCGRMFWYIFGYGSGLLEVNLAAPTR